MADPVSITHARIIPLSRGLHAVIDADDYDRVAAFRWHANAVNRGRRFYAVRHIALVDGGRKRFSRQYLHRFIMDAKVGEVIDHLNGDSLDNRKSNLRVCTQRENLINSVNAIEGGAFFDIQTNRWFARIAVNGKRVFLGRFNTEAEARAAVQGGRRAAGQFQHPDYQSSTRAAS